MKKLKKENVEFINGIFHVIDSLSPEFAFPILDTSDLDNK